MHRCRHKLQSAMEYLMTYGWAILIIAVVLGALFGLGFFNSANLSPKIGPGACQVYRPNGPGTTSFVNLEGTCNNELPQYVASFNGKAYVAIQNGIEPLAASPRTITLWYLSNVAQPVSAVSILFGYGSENCNQAAQIFDGNTNSQTMVTSWCSDMAAGPTVVKNTWYFVAFTYTGTIQGSYVGSGAQLYTASESVSYNTLYSTYIAIGQGTTSGAGFDTRAFNGMIANVQMYNSSLSSNEVTALYDEGIGGVPINANHLIGWWPLNGNANDYSGNEENGVATNVVFTSSWTSSYTAP